MFSNRIYGVRSHFIFYEQHQSSSLSPQPTPKMDAAGFELSMASSS